MSGDRGGSPKPAKPVLEYAKVPAPFDFRLILKSRIPLVCSGLFLFLLIAYELCGANTGLLLSVLLTDGVIAVAWIAGACALGAVILKRLHIDTNRALYLATASGIGLGIFSLLGLGLGLLGWLSRPVAIAFPAVSLLLWIADRILSGATPVRRYAEEPGLRARSDPALRNTSKPAFSFKQWVLAPAGVSWLWLVPLVSLTIALVSASMMPGILWKPLDPHPYDVTGYHLLVPREWYEGGRIVPLEHNVYSFFEFNVEIQFLLLMHAMGGPWAAMYACQFLCVGYAGLMVLAVVGATSGREYERPTSNPELSSLRRSTFAFSSFLAAALASTVPWVIMLAGVAYVESALMLYTALSIAWAMYAIRRPDHLIRSLLLSGILAGFACGVKITAVPMLLLAVPVGTFAVLMIRRPIKLPVRRLMIGCAGLVLAGSIVVSPWLIRNFIWAGNPLFPVGMKALGKDHFDDVQVKRFHDAHSPAAALKPFAAKLTLLWRDVLDYWQFGHVLLPAGLIACFVRWRDRQSWLLFICGAFVLVVWIGFTHLLPRFLVMLVPIAAIAIARINWGRSWPAGVALLLIAAGLGWSKVIPELLRQPALIGIEDTSFMMQDSQQLVDARDRGMQIGMVGDAQAFLYPIPLRQMHYRAVFNLHTGTDDPILAWIGPEPIGNPNWLLVINPNEIERLHATYFGVPALPADWAAHKPDTFFLRGDQLRFLKSPDH